MIEFECERRSAIGTTSDIIDTYGGSNSDYGQYDWFHWETENCDIN